MHFLMMVFLMTPAVSFANLDVKALKSYDGAVAYCEADKDNGQLGFKLEHTQVNFAASDKETLELSFVPSFYKCVQTPSGYEWQKSDIQSFLNHEVETDEGVVKIDAVSYKWIAYTQNFKELQPESTNTPTKYSLKVTDLLDGKQKVRRNQGLPSHGAVTVFLRSVTKAIYPDGREMPLGYGASGSFNILVTLPAQ